MLDADFRRGSPRSSDSSSMPGQWRSGASGIAGLVALDFGLDADDLYRRTRGSPREALARQVAMYLTHIVYAASFDTIARAFGRDRTTVSHACGVIEDRRDDQAFDGRLALLESKCRRLAGSAGDVCPSAVAECAA